MDEKKKKGGCLGLVIVFLLFSLLFCPGWQQHKKAIQDEVLEHRKAQFGYLGYMDMNVYLPSSLEFESNYIFSKTVLDGKTVSVGFFGFVWTKDLSGIE